MRRSQSSYLLYLILVCVAQAGCASTPSVLNVRNWIPGSSAKAGQALDAQLSLARLSERHGDPDAAEKIYQAVLKKDPQNQLAHHRLGVLAAKSGQLDKASEYLDAAARLGPPSGPLLNDIGFNLLMLDRLPEAEATFRRALEIDPKNQSARNNLGLVLGETGRYEESLAEFRQAGGEAEAQSNLAYCKTRAGDLQGAKSAYHRALSLNQELKPAAEALMQLAQQSPQPAPADPALSEPKRARVSRMQGNGADFLETIQPANPRPAQAEQAAWISATLPGSPGMEAGIREPSLPAREAAGQDASGFIPARVFRFSEGSQSTVTTEVHRRQTPPTDLYERPRPAVPGVASAANAGGTFTAPNLFGSPASTPTMHPWQAPTWTPDFGGVFAPGQPLPTTPEAGTVMPSGSLPNLVQ